MSLDPQLHLQESFFFELNVHYLGVQYDVFDFRRMDTEFGTGMGKHIMDALRKRDGMVRHDDTTTIIPHRKTALVLQ